MKNHFSALRKLAAMLVFLGICATSFAQQKISGTVVDVTGQPVIGASVLEKGSTTNGVIVDLDGAFSMTVPTGSTLVVSCIGYVDSEISVTAGQSVYNVVLSDDSEMLEETVVIGYGTAKVRDLTGSVSTVSSKDLDVPVANVAQALQGKMAGVVVTMNDGTPGAAPQIRVRGTKSITQTNEPLYIVDGFPVSNLNAVPADQIKSINVLKDAAATAIYGSRGAAGVVLVTTKNAIEGQTSVSYNGFVQIKDSSASLVDVLETPDYLKFTLGYARDFGPTSYDNMLDYYGIASTGNATGVLTSGGSKYNNMAVHNWQSDLYKTAIAHSHNITISNGTKKNKTLFSLNYMNDDGTVINSGYERINASLKTIENLTDKFSIELNASYSYTENTRGGANAANAYRYHALEPLGNASNTSGFGNGSPNVETSYDPVELAWNSTNTSYNHDVRAIAAANYKPIEDLTLRSEIGLSKGFSKNMNYNAGFGNETNSATLGRGESASMHWTNTVSYQIPFKNKNHRADVMVGSEMIKSSGSSMSFYGFSYPSNFDKESTFAFLSQFTENYTFSTNIDTPGSSLSFFTRANYQLMDKYLFTLTLRADGSSKFAPNNRWGYFPAAAFAWRVIDEDFMAGSKDWLSNLKLRLSYGVTGSDAISANLWKETWELGNNSTWTSSSSRVDTENDYVKTYAPKSMMMNDNLKWESTISRNLGVDFGFLNERIYGSVEGYWATTKDLLMPVAVNSTTGYTYQYQNMGTTSNRGIELSIGGDIVRTNDFNLSANFIYNYNVNRVEKLAKSVMVNTYGQWASSEGTPTNGEFILKEGEAIGTIRAYKYEGWYTTKDFDYANGVYTLKEGNPDVSFDSYWTSLGRPAGQMAFPGAVKVVDYDGDRTMDEDDLYVVGEMTPRSTGSFNINARWKNLDISTNFNYVIGGMLMNTTALYSSYGSKDNRFGANRTAMVAGAYSPYTWENGELCYYDTPEDLDRINANATMHTPQTMKGPLLDCYLEDASYLRLKNLTIGYTLPRSFAQKVGMKNVRAYFTATNLLTLTKYTGLDPEVNTARSAGYGFPTPGVDRNAYPIAKGYTFGLNITL